MLMVVMVVFLVALRPAPGGNARPFVPPREMDVEAMSTRPPYALWGSATLYQGSSSL